MARLFDDTASQYLEVNSAPVTVVPFTVSCWFNSNDSDLTQSLLWIGDKDYENRYYTLCLRGDLIGDPIDLISRFTTSYSAQTTSGYSTGQWHHACGVVASVTDRRTYIDGGSKGTNATSSTPVGLDRISIGRFGDSSPGAYMSGMIAEISIWSGLALSDAEVALLAKGVPSLLVNPSYLRTYIPLIGRYSPEIDLMDGRNLTVTGATVADHPRILYPVVLPLSFPVATASPLTVRRI